MDKNRVFVFDVTYNGEYKGQLGFEYCPLFPVDSRDIHNFVEKKIPSVKGLKFRVEPVLTIEADKYRKYKVYRKSN